MSLLYFLFIIIVLGSALYLNAAAKLQLQRDWKAFLIAFVAVCIPFILEDIYATDQGHWSFSDRFTSSIRLAGMPTEEILFFIAVPLVMLCIWQLVKARSKEKQVVHDRLYAAPLIVFGLFLFLSGGAYSRIIGPVFIVSVMVLAAIGRFHSKQFWVFQGFLLIAFLVGNTFLTLPPIVSYNSEAITGLRIGTIPIEDFAYNFVLINWFIIVYEKAKSLLK